MSDYKFNFSKEWQDKFEKARQEVEKAAELKEEVKQASAELIKYFSKMEKEIYNEAWGKWFKLKRLLIQEKKWYKSEQKINKDIFEENDKKVIETNSKLDFVTSYLNIMNRLEEE